MHNREDKHTTSHMDIVSKEIAHNVLLLRRETTDSIVYEVDNAKYKRILFRMDFRGSDNLALTTGGLEREVAIPPYTKVQIACLKVRNTTKISQLKVKYTWEEQDPHDTPAHLPKREMLAPDIFLYTTRESKPSTEFHYSIFCGKYKRLRFTMDFRGSSNIKLTDGSLLRTIYVEPFEKKKIGVMRAQDPASSWSLKSKYTWVEEEPTSKQPTLSYIPQSMQTSVEEQHQAQKRAADDARRAEEQRLTEQEIRLNEQEKRLEEKRKLLLEQEHLANIIGNREFGKVLDPPPLPSTSVGSYAIPKTQTPPSNVATGAFAPISRAQLSMPTTSRREIATNITLISARTDHPTGHTSFVFCVDCMKYKDLSLVLDFRGSSNLVLDNGGLYTQASLKPYERKEVATLRTIEANTSWSLKQKVSVIEEVPKTEGHKNITDDSESSRGHQRYDVTRLHRRQSFNNVYTRQPDGTWANGSQMKPRSFDNPRTPNRVMLAKTSAAPRRDVEVSQTQLNARESLDNEDSASRNALASSGNDTEQLKTGKNLSTLLTLLIGCGLQQYYPLFLGEAMADMGLLQSLAAHKADFRQCLKDLGIAKMGHRETILKAVVSYGQ